MGGGIVQGTVREVAGHKRAVAVRTPTLAHAPCRLGFGQPIDALSVGVQVSQRVMSGGTTVRCAALVRAASGQVGWTLFALRRVAPKGGRCARSRAGACTFEPAASSTCTHAASPLAHA